MPDTWTFVRMDGWRYVVGFTRTKTIIFYDRGGQKDMSSFFDYDMNINTVRLGIWPVIEEPFEVWVRRIRSEHEALQEMSGTES